MQESLYITQKNNSKKPEYDLIPKCTAKDSNLSSKKFLREDTLHWHKHVLRTQLSAQRSKISKRGEKIIFYLKNQSVYIITKGTINQNQKKNRGTKPLYKRTQFTRDHHVLIYWGSPTLTNLSVIHTQTELLCYQFIYFWYQFKQK